MNDVFVQLQAKWILSSKHDLKEETILSPERNQPPPKYPLVLQFAVLIVNITLITLFSWRYAISFHLKNDSVDSVISSENAHGIDFLLWFPDIEKAWLQWPVFILIESLAVIDFASSLLYLKTLFESNLGRSYCKFLSYSKRYSPTYSFLVAFQTIWLQQVYLSSVNSSSLGNLFNLSSVLACFQSIYMIVCGASCFWLKIAESGLYGYTDRSSDEDLKFALKIGSPVLQIMNFMISLFILVANVKDMTFDSSWLKWMMTFLLQLWLFIRTVEYIINVFSYEEEEEDLADQKTSSDMFIEMTDFASRDQQKEAQVRSHLKDFRRIGNVDRIFKGSKKRPPFLYHKKI